MFSCTKGELCLCEAYTCSPAAEPTLVLLVLKFVNIVCQVSHHEYPAIPSGNNVVDAESTHLNTHSGIVEDGTFRSSSTGSGGYSEKRHVYGRSDDE